MSSAIFSNIAPFYKSNPYKSITYRGFVWAHMGSTLRLLEFEIVYSSKI